MTVQNMGANQECLHYKRFSYLLRGYSRGTLSCMETITTAEITQLLLKTPASLAISGKQDTLCVLVLYCSSVLHQKYQELSKHFNQSK